MIMMFDEIKALEEIEVILEDRNEVEKLILKIKEKISNNENITPEQIKLYISLNNKNEIIRILKVNNFENFLILNKKFPDISYKLIIEFDLLGELKKIKNDTFEYRFIISTFEKVDISEVYNLSKKVSNKTEYFIFFCDRYGIPANTIEIIRNYKNKGDSIDEQNLINIIEINRSRNNLKFIDETLSYTGLFKNKNKIYKYLPTLISTTIETNFTKKIYDILNKYCVQGDQVYSDMLYHIKLKKDKILPIDLYNIYKNQTEDLEGFMDRILSDKDPVLFNKLIDSLNLIGNNDAAHKMCLNRLKYWPNSVAVIRPLVRAFGKYTKLALALNLQRKFNEKYHIIGDDMIEAHAGAKLGDWHKYESEFNKYYKYIEFLGGNRPKFAMGEMFFIDAAPNISFDKKLSIYKIIAEAKVVRKKIKYTGRKNIGLFSGDLRRHAMYPFLQLTIQALNEVNCNLHIFSTSPTSLNDDYTKEIETKYKIININPYNNKDLDYIRSMQLDLAIDMSQHTEFNSINYFKSGIATRQITSFWAGGFSTGMTEFEYIILDKYSFEHVKEGDLIEKPVYVQNALMVGPTHMSKVDLKKLPDKITLGIFCRPNRLNMHVFELAAKISNLYNYNIIYDHYQCEQSDVKQFIYSKFISAGIKPENIIIKSSPLASIISEVHAVIDSFPACSPTTTRDLIHMGVPVFTIQNSDPYSRFSASFLHGLGLDYLIYKGVDELLNDMNEVLNIRSRFLNEKITEKFKNAETSIIKNLSQEMNFLINYI